MKQLTLDLSPDAPPTLDNFIAGHNAELLSTLALLAAGDEAQPPLPSRHLYLWGGPGSGRSHLLHATLERAMGNGRAVHYLNAADVRASLPETEGALMAVDNVERLGAEAQIALFNAFNRSRLLRQSLLLSGPLPPRTLKLREDLRTRIGQCLIYEVQPLDDAARARILATLAERRGLRLADEVTEFLLRHGNRDLSSLRKVLDALDAGSLERKRPITLPLLRELMQHGLSI